MLCRKLSKLGIEGQLMVWIKNFLSGRMQRVVVQEELSQETSVRSGVPQGSVLGPVLNTQDTAHTPHAHLFTAQ